MEEHPDKLYYSISEVAELTGIKPHVLRYWESEFPTLRPRKSRSGNRSYRKRDVEEILAIKKLLYDEGFRIAGARKLRREAHTAAKVAEDFAPPPQMAIPFAQLDPQEQMRLIRRELSEIFRLVRHMKEGAQRKAG